MESDVVANDGAEGRIYLFLLDETRPDNALRTRLFLRRFLEQHFGPNDLAAVALTGRGVATDGHGFTGSAHRLLEAVDKYTGGFVRSDEPRALLGCQSGDRFRRSEHVTQSPPRALPFEQWSLVRVRLSSVRSAAELMAAIPGARKSILYFTECLGHDMFEVRDYRSGILTLEGEDAQAAMAAATRGNVSFYPIDPSGLTLEGGLEFIETRADLARWPR